MMASTRGSAVNSASDVHVVKYLLAGVEDRDGVGATEVLTRAGVCVVVD